MKPILALILLCAFALPAFTELTDTDVDKIRLLINEELKPIKADIEELKADVETLKTEAAVVRTEIQHLKGTLKIGLETNQKNFDSKFESLEKNFDSRFESLEDNFDRQNNIIIACIGIPLAILAIGGTVWGILANRRIRKDQTLERQVQTLTEELEAMKRQQIVRP